MPGKPVTSKDVKFVNITKKKSFLLSDFYGPSLAQETLTPVGDGGKKFTIFEDHFLIIIT